MIKSPFNAQVEKRSAGLLLWQTTQEWQRATNEALLPYEMPHAQFVLLSIIFSYFTNDEEVTQAMLVEMSHLDKMTVSKSLRKLEAEHLVSREPQGGDSRVWSLSLTKIGLALTKKLIRAVEHADAEFFGRLTKSDQKTLVQLLGALDEGI